MPNYAQFTPPCLTVPVSLILLNTALKFFICGEEGVIHGEADILVPVLQMKKVMFRGVKLFSCCDRSHKNLDPVFASRAPHLSGLDRSLISVSLKLPSTALLPALGCHIPYFRFTFGFRLRTICQSKCLTVILISTQGTEFKVKCP